MNIRAPRIALIGPQKAGKTTLVRTLSGVDPFGTTPTLGLDISFVSYLGVTFEFHDLGGHPSFTTELGEQLIRNASAVIFVLDSADSSMFEQAHRYIDLVWKSLPEGAPLVFFANKYDREDVLPLDKIVEELQLKRFMADRLRSFAIFYGSGLTGANVYEPVLWLIRCLLPGVVLDKQVLYMAEVTDSRTEDDEDCLRVSLNTKIKEASKSMDMANLLMSSLENFSREVFSDNLHSVNINQLVISQARCGHINAIVYAPEVTGAVPTRMAAEYIAGLARDNQDMPRDDMARLIKVRLQTVLQELV